MDEDLFKKNIFHYFEDLLFDLEMRTLHVNNLDDAKECFSKRILIVENMPRVLEVKLRRLGQRTHDHGNPICVMADLTLERLLPSEIDVFKHVTTGRYSDYVSICEMDSGTAFLEFSDSSSIVFSISFKENKPIIHISFDCYNESWEDSEGKLMMPTTVRKFLSAAKYDTFVSNWHTIESEKRS